MTIQFRFNLQKAIEVTAMLRKLHGSKIFDTDLQQMLYLIDRCSIRDTNYPIIGGTYVRHETVRIGEVNRCLFWEYKVEKWRKYFSFRGGYLDLIADPGNQNLSEREEEQIRFIYETIIYLGLSTFIFNFPEWESSYKYSTLDTVKLLKILGKTDEEIEEIRSIALRENYLDELLGEKDETN